MNQSRSGRRRPPPTSRARSKRQRSDRWGIILIALSLLVALFAGYKMWSTKVEVLDEFGCLEGNAAPVAHTIVLVDQTNSLNPQQLAFARATIFNEFLRLPIHGKLTVRSIDDSVEKEKDRLTICRVKSGSEAKGFDENAKQIEKYFRTRVGGRLTVFLKSLAEETEKAKSPIFESIDDVYGRIDFNRNIKNRRLVIISDMAQNTPDFNQYGCRSREFELPRGIEMASADEVRGSSIVIQYVKRKGLCMQGDAHEGFWRDLYLGMGAGDVWIGYSLMLGRGADEKIYYENSRTENGIKAM